jgi:hypothetical protein
MPRLQGIVFAVHADRISKAFAVAHNPTIGIETAESAALEGRDNQGLGLGPVSHDVLIIKKSRSLRRQSGHKSTFMLCLSVP